MTFVTRVALFAALIAAPQTGRPQNANTGPRPGADSAVVQASTKYGASGIHEFMLGKNYREYWAKPMTVPVLNLSRYAGGLKALEEGGNAQTRNLHLQGADGREYVFRPVYKEVLQLDDVLRHTLIEDLFADGLSASHPAATVLPNAFLRAAGLLHPEPELYVMPDDPKLGEFHKHFAGKLGTIEEFPEDPREGTGFGGAVDIIDSEDLLEKINKDATNRIDAHALLTARLIDLLIGDNDRHPGQWKWARLQEGKDALWIPIPRDRDKAFVSYDGNLLGIARLALPRLVKFTHIPHTAAFYNAVNFDRRLLVGMTRAEFDSTAKFLQRVITDSVIDAAFRSMPKEYQAIKSDVPARTRGRRNILVQSADGYYKSLFNIVDLHGTDAADKATITRQADGSVDIRLEANGYAYVDRTFSPTDTKEIRLYLQGGDDSAIITGQAPRSIPLWVIGGTGANTIDDQSVVRGRRSPTRMYDRGGTPEASVIVEKGDVDLDKQKGEASKDSAGEKGEGKKLEKRYDPDTAWNRLPMVKFQGWEVGPFRDRGASLRPTLTLKTGRGLGIMPQLEFSRRKFGFRQYPYASKMELEVGYSTALKGWEAELKTDNRIESSRMFVTTETGISELIAGRYAGFGNNIVTPADRSTMLAKQRQFEFTPGLGWALGLQTEFTMGPIVKFTVTDSLPNRIISQDRPYGFRRFGQAGFRMHFLHESMRRIVSHGGTPNELLSEDPRSGMVLEAEATVYPPLIDATSTYGTLSAIASSFVTLPLPLSPVFASRIGGQQNFGTYPYFDAAFLGGRQTIRTLHRQEYAGDAVLYGSAELRIPIASFPLVLPVNTGIFGFVDAGRVYMDGKSPGGWHRGMGVGMWLGVLKASTSISVMYTDNRDRRVLLGAGFPF